MDRRRRLAALESALVASDERMQLVVQRVGETREEAIGRHRTEHDAPDQEEIFVIQLVAEAD